MYSPAVIESLADDRELQLDAGPPEGVALLMPNGIDLDRRRRDAHGP